MNKKQFSNEPVKKALSETTRAISKKNDLTINFENEATKNPPPPKFPFPEDVTASANPTATAASIAFPPFLRISIPA